MPVILDYFNKTCVGKANCTLDLKDPDYPFLRPTDGARAKSCKSDHTEIFTQFSCTIDEAASAKKWNQVTGCVCLISLIGIVLALSINHIESVMAVEFAEVDLLSSTAGDYTVEVRITENIYNHFYAHRRKLIRDH